MSAKGLNKAFFVGHLGRDPEVRNVKDGTPLVYATIAIPYAKRDGDQWVEHVDWIRVTAFGRACTYLAQYARKGDLLGVECVVRPSKWVDRNGVTQYSTSLLVDKVLFLSSRKKAGTPQGTEEPPPHEDADFLEGEEPEPEPPDYTPEDPP